MKICLLALLVIILPLTSSLAGGQSNGDIHTSTSCLRELTSPLSSPSDLFFGALPFDQVKTVEILPALLNGLRLSKERFEAIRANPDAPSFENTIEALEALDEPTDQVERILENLSLTNRL